VTRWFLCVVVVAAATGCDQYGFGESTTDAFAPTAAPTGIYTLTASSLTDTCDPPRFTGTLAVDVFQSDSGVGLFDGDATTQQRYDLPSATGYTLDVPGATAGDLDPCGSAAGDSVTLSYVLTSATSESLTVVADQQWTIVTTCTGSVGGVTVPAASCHATRTLHYELAQTCASPCTLTSTTTTNDAGVAASAPACTCN
jgi:hypothetical protein